MQLRIPALFAAGVLVALSVVFASKPLPAGQDSAVPAAAAKYVVVEPDSSDCPWEASSAA
ncbi:hypothetical protein [Actinoplanes sp. URMC 104]|uniref:hypothetical protein n=1 Tax=Actinoplanes sp. URMC 104 TaxID=3423409 RepID=UPI003F1A57B3